MEESMKSRTLKTMKRHIRAYHDLATESEHNAGFLWYKGARLWAEDLADTYGVTLGQVAQLTSLLYCLQPTLSEAHSHDEQEI